MIPLVGTESVCGLGYVVIRDELKRVVVAKRLVGLRQAKELLRVWNFKGFRSMLRYCISKTS